MRRAGPPATFAYFSCRDSSLAPLLLAVVLAAGCGGDDGSRDAASTAAPGSGTDVLSIAIDPADGTLLAGGGPAFYRVRPGAKAPETAAGTIKTAEGLRHADQGRRRALQRRRHDHRLRPLRRGHAAGRARPGQVDRRGRDLGADLRPRRGRLPRDRDRRRPDLRAAQRGPGHDPDLLRRRQDVGARARRRPWPRRSTSPSTPATRDQWAVSTDQGMFISANEGKSWRQRDTTFGARIAWASPTRSTARARTARSSSARTAAAPGGRRHDRRRPEGADRQPQGRALRVGRGRRDPPLGRRRQDLDQGRHARIARCGAPDAVTITRTEPGWSSVIVGVISESIRARTNVRVGASVGVP